MRKAGKIESKEWDIFLKGAPLDVHIPNPAKMPAEVKVNEGNWKNLNY